MLSVVSGVAELREFSDENLRDPAYRGWLRDLDVVRTLHRLEYLLPLAPASVDDYVRNVRASGTDAFFAVYDKSDGAFVGTARLGHIDWRQGSGDVGVLIGDRSRQGKGLATAAVRALCVYGFDELGLRRITGGTPGNNEAMARCFEKLGFVAEGRRRKSLRVGQQWVDHALFGLFPEELVR